MRQHFAWGLFRPLLWIPVMACIAGCEDPVVMLGSNIAEDEDTAGEQKQEDFGDFDSVTAFDRDTGYSSEDWPDSDGIRVQDSVTEGEMDTQEYDTEFSEWGTETDTEDVEDTVFQDSASQDTAPKNTSDDTFF